jgi:hypothetical protein
MGARANRSSSMQKIKEGTGGGMRRCGNRSWVRGASVALGLMAVVLTARAEWYDDMKIKADLRYRFERIDQEGTDVRWRERLRARVGVFPRLGPDFDVGFQLSTDESKNGIADPVSRNQTLTDAFAPKGVWIDLAYMDWHPAFLKGFDAIGGKMKNPFLQVAKDFPVDPDITPEGIAGTYRLGDDLQLLANAGYNWIYERSAAADSKLYVGQVAVNFKLPNDSFVLVGGTCYGMDNMKGFDVIDWSGANKSYGNSTVKGSVSGSTTNKAYATEFVVAEGFAQAGTTIGLPVMVYGSYINNIDADNNGSGRREVRQTGKPRFVRAGLRLPQAGKGRVPRPAGRLRQLGRGHGRPGPQVLRQPATAEEPSGQCDLLPGPEGARQVCGLQPAPDRSGGEVLGPPGPRQGQGDWRR